MRLGLSLFMVYVVGKAVAFALHGFAFTLATIPVLFWQDALIAALIALTFRCSKKAALVLYAAALLHFAISMPLLRLMATPLTVPLLRAGGGTLADSIAHHVDFVNLALLTGTLAAGTLLPLVLSRLKFRMRFGFVAATGLAIISGVFFTGSSDLQGLHRNSVVAFAQSLESRSGFEVVAMLAPGEGEVRPSSVHGRVRGANVLLIGLESTGAKHLSTYGAMTDPMPFLAALAREGMVFENAYAAYPESIKGLFTLLFSRQPRFGFDPEKILGWSESSLATLINQAGYDTALFHSGRFMYLGMDNVVAAAGFDHAADAGSVSGNHQSSFGVDDFATVDHLLSWLDGRDGTKPFFLHYLPISGHHPYESQSSMRGPFRGGDDQSRYLGALRYSDLALRRLVQGLERRALLEKTLLVIYGDHGEAFGEHPGNYGHTLQLFEENVRVPLIFWMPGKLEPARIDRVTSLVDLAPTICDLLGIPSAASFEGISAFSVSDRPVLFLTEYSLRIEGIRFGDWKLILERETGYTRLYDLVRDPAERTNLARAHPHIARALQRRFLEWSPPAPGRTLRANPKTVAQR